MNVFISYSKDDEQWAEKLIKTLEARGLSIITDKAVLESGKMVQDEIEGAMQSAQAIVLLVGPDQPSDSMQQMAWTAALEIAWIDSYKPLVPMLIKNAELPPFLGPWRSKALRVENAPEDMERAAEKLVEALQADVSGAGGGPPTYSSAASDPPTGDEKSAQGARLSEIGKAGARL